ncbi:silencing defective protein Sde2 [Clonorchis sinensis]|uniref:Silencing defective protein Sde2 n=1 Tax=Clonorchis sinensis TaxID=79923 RepID=A0A8T1LZT0_CLOSI|nr:silencing defective protein Sde2 [Clonorchis sinensis]
MPQVCTPSLDCFHTVNGRLVSDLSQVPKDAVVQTHYRLRGGKGGFGSMLRAIGSQIEKTTNHEMCRDLSGRRMRDVNMERKLKEWYAKASDREREKMEKYYERRRKRQEMLAQGPLPGHKFSDREYERQKRKITYELQGALDTAIAQIIGEKSNANGPSTSGPSEPKRTKLWIERLDGETSSSSSSSGLSEDEDMEERISPIKSVSLSTERSERLEDPQSIRTESVQPSQQAGEEAVLAEQHQTAESPENGKDSPVPAKKQPMGLIEEQSSAKPVAEPLTDSELSQVNDAHSLESYGLDVLKESLVARGLKCGGTIQERAARLFSIRGLQPEDYPPKIRAKPK